MSVSVGTAGWAIPRDIADRFPADGTSLERYAARFLVAEINSSFHRSHRRSTWERWRDSVPPDFRFSVKVPKTITHQHKLHDCGDLLTAFVDEAGTLGSKLAVVLVQLPPKLAFEIELTTAFFADLQRRTDAAIACEPRHPSWFSAEVDELLQSLEVARVAADPACCEGADHPGGCRGLAYWRLHGSPVKYRSSYADRLDSYAALLTAEQNAWCIFDNTASSAAAGDALTLMQAIGA